MSVLSGCYVVKYNHKVMPAGKLPMRALLCSLAAVKGLYGPGEIAARAQAAAEEIHVDIATIYRWLWMARRLFAQERGLRVKDASSAWV